jgi:crotonobetaine/carnitine-CoA ligase
VRHATAGELLDAARRWAAALREVGVQPGDRVALLLPNGTDFVTFWLAVGLTGAVEVPVNVEQRGPVLAHVLEDSAPRLILTAPQWLPAIKAAGYTGPASVLPWEPARRAAFDTAPPLPLHVPTPENLAVIMYTSGTTGPSKGVMLSHSYFDNIGPFLSSIDPAAGAGDVFYLCTPMFHIDARMLVSGALRTGATVAWAPRFSARGFWPDIRKFHATGFIFIGAMLAILTRTSTAEDAAGHRLRLGVGAPIPAEAYAFFEDQLGIQLCEAYGLTEAVAVTWGTPGRHRRGSAGWAAGPYQVRVVSDDDEPVPPRQVGEIVFRPTGPGLMTLGYWHRPEVTVECFRDLWFHTGDLGRLDADGFLWFVGRRKDMIRRRGENVSAFEVESTIARLKGVLECAALPVPDELGGEEEIYLLVVPVDGARLEPSVIAAYAEAHLARFAVPRYVDVVADLPHTPTGKLAKHAILAAPGPATWDRRRDGPR